MKAILFSVIFIISVFAIDFDKLNPYKEADFKILEDNLESFIAKCKAGDGKSCRLASLVYGEKYRKSREIEFGKLRVEYSFRGCDLRDGISCLAIAVEYGDAVSYLKVLEVDLEKEMEYLHKACDYNEINSCNLLGHRYSSESRSKKGSEKKSAQLKAKHFYKKACKLGHDVACKEK